MLQHFQLYQMMCRVGSRPSLRQFCNEHMAMREWRVSFTSWFPKLSDELTAVADLTPGDVITHDN